jgi:hypothetical protein
MESSGFVSTDFSELVNVFLNVGISIRLTIGRYFLYTLLDTVVFIQKS